MKNSWFQANSGMATNEKLWFHGISMPIDNVGISLGFEPGTGFEIWEQIYQRKNRQDLKTEDISCVFLPFYLVGVQSLDLLWRSLRHGTPFGDLPGKANDLDMLKPVGDQSQRSQQQNICCDQGKNKFTRASANPETVHSPNSLDLYCFADVNHTWWLSVHIGYMSTFKQGNSIG